MGYIYIYIYIQLIYIISESWEVGIGIRDINTKESKHRKVSKNNRYYKTEQGKGERKKGRFVTRRLD